MAAAGGGVYIYDRILSPSDRPSQSHAMPCLHNGLRIGLSTSGYMPLQYKYKSLAPVSPTPKHPQERKCKIKDKRKKTKEKDKKTNSLALRPSVFYLANPALQQG